jgi:hypothetical protein
MQPIEEKKDSEKEPATVEKKDKKEKKTFNGPPDEKDQPEEVVEPLKEGEKIVQTLEVPKNKHFKNLASPFLSQKKVWFDEAEPAMSLKVP